MSGEPTTPDLPEAFGAASEALNRRDFDAAVAIYSEGAVFDLSRLGMEVLEGRDAIRGFLVNMTAAYDDYGQEPLEFRDLGGGVSFVVVRQWGRLKGASGLLENRVAIIATVADGLVERAESYDIDIDAARATAKRLAEERG